VIDFKHRHAGHCESGTVSALLRHEGLDLSEPMVFGIGGGLFFLHMPWVRIGGIPFTSYRDAPRVIQKNVGKRLGFGWKSQRYFRPATARRELDAFLDAGRPVGIQTNIYWLSYFPPEIRFHFNGHNLVVYGREGDTYHVSDPVADIPTQTTAAELERARFAKGVFAPRGLVYYPVNVPKNPDLKPAIRDAIRVTARRMIHAPVPPLGVRGIRWLATRMARWPEMLGEDKARKWVGSVVRMQEEIGTGGAGFRFMYAAFLQEAGELLNDSVLRETAKKLTATGDRWREFALQGALLVKQRESGGAAYQRLADILHDCGQREKEIFTRLAKTA
jgi:hypothetical protein